jgi:rhamnulose-1-phosphate aldolase
MPVNEPFPELDEVIASIGAAGHRIAAIDASEGAAGNISVCVGWPVEVRRRFPLEEPIELPVPAPSLAGRTVIVTGSGRRLRALVNDPDASLGAVLIDEGGRTGTLFTSRRRLFERLTSEWNSHLAVHEDVIGRSGTNFQAIVHAQPPHLTYLSHIPAYRDQAYADARLLRWEPETLVALPAGIGMLPFAVPGSPELMAANVQSLRARRIVVWGKHGVMARSNQSVTRAVDRVEYAETAARYEYMDLLAGGLGEGLTVDEMRLVKAAFSIETDVL